MILNSPSNSQQLCLESIINSVSPSLQSQKQDIPGQTCIKCEEWKPLDQYEIQPSGKSYRHDCIDCRKKANLLLRELHKTAPPKPDVCDLCHLPGDLVLDHDHKTGKFRGWIHDNCNRGIAYLGDSYEGVQNGLVYLSPK